VRSSSFSKVRTCSSCALSVWSCAAVMVMRIAMVGPRAIPCRPR
jgi:hypothetical protein